jgi:CrcB protein
MRLAYFFLASGLGAVTRYLIDTQMRRLFSFPVGILIVNALGSFLLGVVISDGSDLAFALIGFSGALTTWSAFALDLDDARRSGRNKEFFINIGLNYGVTIASMLLGLWVSR